MLHSLRRKSNRKELSSIESLHDCENVTEPRTGIMLGESQDPVEASVVVDTPQSSGRKDTQNDKGEITALSIMGM